MAIVKEYEMKVNTADAQENVEDLNKEIKETGTDISGVEAAADKATGGMISGFKSALGGVKKLAVGFRTLGGAIMATGLGALVLVVASLTAAFKGSEEGQNKFAKIMAVIGAITGNLVDLLADLGEAIIAAFENPKKAIQDFSNLIKNNIETRLKGLLNLIPNLGKAVSALFKGNFSEAGKIAADSVGQVVLGVDSVTDSIKEATAATKEYIKEQVREGKEAAKVADMRARADKIERGLIVDRSKLESEIALLRLKSRQEEEFSATERKQALLDAQVLEDQLLDKETQFLELRRDAQVLENTFSRSNKENLTKEAEAIAAVNRQQASRANTARQVQREVNTISKQIEAEDTRAANEKKRKDDELRKQESDAEKALADLKTKIRDSSAVQEDDIRNLEIIKVKEHYANLIKLAKENGLDVVALEKAQSDKINSLNQKNAKDEIYWETLTQDQKIKIVSDGLNNLASILGKETAAGKAAAIASATINTFQSAQASYKSLAGIPVVGPALGIAASGAAIVSGFKQVQAIRATKVPTLAGQSSPDVGGGGTPSPQAAQFPQVPSFNIVGQSGTNQIADALSTQQQKPVKAFVVAADVTSGQSLERNIIEGASL
tara:strand:+ start:164 stop:1990 length:1827 start_codon:yes stop_codon:yes gene_type:complete